MSTPLPPIDLNKRDPLLSKLPAGTTIHRFYSAQHDPIYFDTSLLGRFNAPDASYGVLYGAETINGAFCETFLRVPGKTLIDPELLQRKAYVRLVTRRELTFIVLAGPGLARVGATAEIPHGGLPYDAPQKWSQALHRHIVNADGIAYRCRHDDSEIGYALFDRSAEAITEETRLTELDQDWFWQAALGYGVGLSP